MKVLVVGQLNRIGATEEVYGRGFLDIGFEVQYFTWQDAEPMEP